MRPKALMTATMIVATSLALLAQGPPAGGGQGRGGAGRGPQTPPLIMTSTAWEDGGVIPDKYTQAAGPTAPSPALSWSQVPPGTQSFALHHARPRARDSGQELEGGRDALAHLEHSGHVDRAA